MVHLTWRRISWIDSAVQLLQQATLNALVVVISFLVVTIVLASLAAASLLGEADVATMHAFFALIGGLGIPCWFI